MTNLIHCTLCPAIENRDKTMEGWHTVIQAAVVNGEIVKAALIYCPNCYQLRYSKPDAKVALR